MLSAVWVNHETNQPKWLFLRTLKVNELNVFIYFLIKPNKIKIKKAESIGSPYLHKELKTNKTKQKSIHLGLIPLDLFCC